MTAPDASTPSEVRINRRRSPRVPLITQVECRATRATSLGRTADVSEGGVLVLTRQPLDASAEVVVRFSLPPIPPGRPTECLGRILRTEPGVSMAITFLEIRE